MKRFLAVCTAIFVLVFAFNRGIIKRTFESYFDDDYFSKTNQNIIEIKIDDTWNPFEIKGVNLAASMPGMFEGEASDYMNDDDYLRWLTYIGDMNANTIRVNTLMPKTFYKALEKYNENREIPIYILQGIYIEQSIFEDGNDINSAKFDEKVKEQIEKVIDYVHGEGEEESIDVSEYVLGYTIGEEWLSNNIVYYEIMNKDNSQYKGKYFSSKEDASSFEIYLCSIADYLVKYESKEYNAQSLISFVGTNPYKVILRNTFVDETIDEEDRTVNKDYVDVENIEPTENLKTGIFVSYSFYPTYTDLLEYENNKDQFLKDINEYHDIPVVISEYGVPAARTVGNYTTLANKTYIDENDQAELLKENYEIIKNSECAGSFINSFQDNWSNRTWNTSESVAPESLINWNDAESYSNSFGLLSFDNGKNVSDTFIDNSNKEWYTNDIVDQSINYTFSCKQNEKYIYFYIEDRRGLSLESKDIFINLDVTPNSGSTVCAEYNLNFNNDVDFLIRLNGKENSRILVHEYYSTKEFLNNKNDLLTKPDFEIINKDTNKFLPIELNTSPRIYLDKEGKFSEEKNTEVGKLIYGNSNPDSISYNSAADFYYGNNYVEVRIAWSLINFMDPSNNLIKDDFYKNLGIKPLEIKEIFAGVSIKNLTMLSETLKSNAISLEKWESPKYHERLKPSYYTIKEVFLK